jgi:predicted nucleotidyltransferase
MFARLLARLAAALDGHAVPYMIIGGQAVLLYGEPRLTRDIDITVGLGIEGIDRLLAVLDELRLDALPENVRSFVQETMVLPAVERASGIRVDFILSFTPYESGAISRARAVEIEGQEVRFASPEDLVIHKIFAGRPRDLEDVRSIVARNPDLDRTYMRRWLVQFDASAEHDPTFVEMLDEMLGQND